MRLGTLSPGACYTADVKFMPLEEGVLGVEAVRVVDLGTGEKVDVREVPEVVAVRKGKEGEGDGVEESDDDVEEEEEE